MSRRDDYDGPEADYDDDPRRKKSNAALIVGLVVGGLVLMLAIVGVVFALLVVTPMRRAPAPVAAVQAKAAEPEKAVQAKGADPATVAKQIRDRADLETLVKGKTKQEVLGLLGKPSTTSGGEFDSWVYHDIARDPITGKTDWFVTIVFGRDGIVSRVHY